MSAPQILILTSASTDLLALRSLEGNLLERGVSFSVADAERLSSAEIVAFFRPEARAVFVSDRLSDALATDPVWKEAFQKFSDRGGALSSFGGRLEVVEPGHLRNILYDSLISGLVENIISYTGIATGDPAFYRQRAARDPEPLLQEEYGKVREWLEKPRAPSEWHLHYGKTIEALVLAGDEALARLYRQRIEGVYAKELSLYTGDHLCALYGPVAVAKTGQGAHLLQPACDLLQKTMKSRPSVDRFPAYAGIAGDSLAAVVKEGWAHLDVSCAMLNGFGCHDCFVNEAVHMQASVTAALGKACDDPVLTAQAVEMCDYAYRVHAMPNGLLRHASRRGRPVGAAWGRGQTHALYGLVYVLDELTPGSAEHDLLLGHLRSHLRALQPHQDEVTGLWRNVIDIPHARLESSCTVGIAFALARALDRGWFDEAQPMLDRAWFGIRAMMHEGSLGAFCRGTVAGESAAYYLARPQGWGKAPQLLMLATELHKLGKIASLPR